MAGEHPLGRQGQCRAPGHQHQEAVRGVQGAREGEPVTEHGQLRAVREEAAHLRELAQHHQLAEGAPHHQADHRDQLVAHDETDRGAPRAGQGADADDGALARIEEVRQMEPRTMWT
ncbi:hypothetical protein ACFW2C_22105 [Streptomyces sp. NPDC058875]|uniref:hypothetical protein n=1 Tax=Streptomyces sp. NPDC058875 TaxID=3346663 RepID=UPI00369C1123